MNKTQKEKLEGLRKHGYRITPQRQKLLDFFLKLPEGEHLSAEELHNGLNNSNIEISLATLYRSLKFLVEQGFLKELDFGENHKHYELSSSNQHHHHIICNKCGFTMEFTNETLAKEAAKVAADYKKFKVIDCQFKIFGLCENCQDKEINT